MYCNSMANVARRLTILACVVLALVAIGVSVFWLYGAERLKVTVAAWEANWRAQGGEVSYQNFELSGFPLWFRVQLDRPVLGRPQSPSPWRWEGPTVRMRMSPFAPRGRSRFPGEHKLDITVLGVPVALLIGAKDAEARYRNSRGETLYAVVGEELSVRVNDEAPLTVHALDFQVLHFRDVLDHLKASARFAFELDDVMLPQGSLPDQFRSQKIDLARLKGDVMGPFQPSFTRAAATAWRDTGGTVEITALELRWGPLNVVAVGTVALDENLQPLAALAATVTGFNETIDALTATGAIQKSEADSAKALLNLLAKPPRLLGGPPEIAVPVTVQNQRLSLGPVALMMLPPIQWPD
jgi:hypothetical protein